MPKASPGKPPSFPHHHPILARKLREKWVQRAKIRSEWNAQKKRDPSILAASHQPENHETAQQIDSQRSRAEDDTRSKPGPSNAVPQPKRSIRDLAREAYSPSAQSKSAGRKHASPSASQGTRTKKGQPNMKLRMNLLLEKIKQKHPN